eukprot:TRINITY_DN6797_c0_g1_i1.p1 TRINITY_DN6797_c0_g1~~TRINITY_DN6797_c0_g1_i1.p1  ORF type:complete len:210 (-),score=58.11 TRINITY_DN6797_c0_g1_i1:44-673(-)
MSFSLFKKAQRAPTPAESISKLRSTLDTLEKREKYLEQRINQENAIAKANASKNRRNALMAIKKRKIYETQCEKLANARLTIEQQIITIESATINFETLSAMRIGARTMQGLNRNMNIDDLEDTVDEIREQMDIANEVGEAIARPIFEDPDADELEAELNKLQEDELEQQFKDIQAPKADATQPIAAKTASVKSPEEAELEALEAEMGF